MNLDIPKLVKMKLQNIVLISVLVAANDLFKKTDVFIILLLYVQKL